MRRTLLPIFLAVAALALPATAAEAASNASVSVDQCGTVSAKKQLGVTFSAEMNGRDKSRTMSIEFQLFSRPAGGTFEREPKADDTASHKAVATYLYGPRTFLLPDLTTATDYRARFIFRWTKDNGDTSTTRRWTSICRLEPQPNLTLGDLTTTAAGQPGVQRYTVPVRNDGRVDAGAFDVTLRIGREDRDPVTVTGLAAGGAQTVSFLAPRCTPGEILRFEADPDDRIAESDERDNVLTVACPI